MKPETDGFENFADREMTRRRRDVFRFDFDVPRLVDKLVFAPT